MGETEEFNTLTFEKKLMQLKDTQESIQILSSWCLKQRNHHKKIVSSWLNVLKRVKVEQRLVLFYLANDVIQYSKRKGYDFVESWGLNLQKATPLVRDEKVRPRILRIFKIWEQRAVYDDEFLTDLTGLLSAGATKKTDDDPLDFQPQQLVNKIKQCTVLEGDAELKLKDLIENDLELSDADELCAHLKDRSLKHDVIKELNDGISYVEKYTQALQREIVARETLLALLTSANQYYSTQRGEVKVVAYAYKNFGSRVRALKRKLDELLPTLPSAAPSPPQRDEDVPSPGPDEDLELPVTGDSGENDVSYNIDQTFNTSISADGSLYNLGLSSFLSTSDNPHALFNDTIDLDAIDENNSEVINMKPDKKQDILNSVDMVTIDSPSNDTTSVGSAVSPNISQSLELLPGLPGLDLLTPDSTGNPPPPISFYGTSLNDEPDPVFPPKPVPVPNPWLENTPVEPHATWIPPPTSARSVFAEPPESPPPAQRAPIAPLPRLDRQETPLADVDQRGLLPPPPPPPLLPLLGQTEDVDHRLLPPTSAPTPVRHTGKQDIDHRNLISLTHQPPVPQTHNSVSMDQDYRIPPMVPPTDIVESVDMDLSDDDEQGMYQASNDQMERRGSFNNNKVLVGGDENNHSQNLNSMKIASIPNNIRHDGPHSAPAQVQPLLSGPRFTPNVSRAAPITLHSAQPVSHTGASLTHMASTVSHVTSVSHIVTTMPHLASTVPHMASTLPHMATTLPHMASTVPRMASTVSHTASTVPHMASTVPHMASTVPHMASTVPHMASTVPHRPQQQMQHDISRIPPPAISHSAQMAPRAAATMPQVAAIRSHTAPIIPPLSNPFDNMPPTLKFTMPDFQTLPPNYRNNSSYNENIEEYVEYNDELSRGQDDAGHVETRNPSPPEYADFGENNWSNQAPRPTMNPRFPRNWTPRTDVRPPNYSPQFRPRGLPRPPNRWAGPRGQRFW